MRKVLVFGAGNIGRGFLGVLLRQSDCEVVFVDVDRARVDLINQHHGYPVFVCSPTQVVEQMISGVRAIYFQDQEAVTAAVCESDIILTAVGKLALPHVAKSLAFGLTVRAQRRPRDPAHVVVVACENVRDNTAYLAEFVWSAIDPVLHSQIKDHVSFPNCIVDRIVPNTKPQSDHPLATTVEDYFQFVIDVSQLQEALPPIAGVEAVSNVAARLDQKLFTLNMAHGVVGYYGVLRGYEYVHQAVADRDILDLVRGALQEVEEVMVALHPSITRSEQRTYAAKIVARFGNPHLQDSLSRVASQPKRKLGRDERFVLPARLLWERGQIPAFLATGIAGAFHFHDDRDPQALELGAAIAGRGLDPVLAEVSGLEPDHPVARAVKADFLLRAL